MNNDYAVLVLRLAGPLQSWGGPSDHNRRATSDRPTKSGIVGLLAAADGRRRGASITDLAELDLGVRVDQPGGLLVDYHTSSDYTGAPLRSAAVNARGVQKRATGTPPKRTHVSRRHYLRDAVFLAAVGGPHTLVAALHHAVQHPAYPLVAGRRGCDLTGQTALDLIQDTTVDQVLATTPWQVSDHAQRRYARQWGRPATVRLPITVDDTSGVDSVTDVVTDVPTSFEPRTRRFVTRQVRHGWVSVSTGFADTDNGHNRHDPFTLLGW